MEDDWNSCIHKRTPSNARSYLTHTREYFPDTRKYLPSRHKRIPYTHKRKRYTHKSTHRLSTCFYDSFALIYFAFIVTTGQAEILLLQASEEVPLTAGIPYSRKKCMLPVYACARACCDSAGFPSTTSRCWSSSHHIASRTRQQGHCARRNTSIFLHVLKRARARSSACPRTHMFARTHTHVRAHTHLVHSQGSEAHRREEG